MTPLLTPAPLLQCARCRIGVPVHLIGLPNRCPDRHCPLRAPGEPSCCEGERAEPEEDAA